METSTAEAVFYIELDMNKGADPLVNPTESLPKHKRIT